MKIKLVKDDEEHFLYRAYHVVNPKGHLVPLGIWDSDTVDEILDSMGFRETTSNIEEGPDTDFIIDFMKREIDFL